MTQINLRIPCIASGWLRILLCFLAAQWLLCNTATASPVDQNEADKMVVSWLTENVRPLRSQLGNQVDAIETYIDEEDKPIYHVVYLKPKGFVIVSADDGVEPVIAFASEGDYDPSEGNPLGDLIFWDMPDRVYSAREIQKNIRRSTGKEYLTEQETTARKHVENSIYKWKKLLAYDNNLRQKTSRTSISDIRVSPLLQSKWGQETSCNNMACFNYYTPPGPEGNADNYPSGCVATAMAQYMRFCQYPATGAGTGCFTVSIDDAEETMCLRGGNGFGGAYDWSQMVLDPDCTTTLEQRQAIGALTYDAGVAVGMQYASDSSGAFMDDAADALTSVFGYSNAEYDYDYNGHFGTRRNNIINPNLDDGNPVIFGAGNHAFIIDGYGYQNSTLYHHLNMGWNGLSDIWYNLPNIEGLSSSGDFEDVIYNIYTNGTGKIISGRVTDDNSGEPIPDVIVIVAKNGHEMYQTATNINGIYAVSKVPSYSNYTVTASRTGYLFDSKTASTGSDNCWAVDFSGLQFDTIVPDVIGLTAENANTAITNARLKISQTNAYNDTVETGKVISQDPAADTAVDVDSTVSIVVSWGKPITPNIVRKNAAAANSMILNAGLIVGTVTTIFSNKIAADNVIQQDPQAGEQVAVNSAVNYIISLGRPIVPNIFNKTAAEADANIVNAGLNIGPIITAYSNTITDEKVISQYPAAGKKAFVGSKVRYIMSLGKPTVPDVAGMTVRDARKAIANRKLKSSLTAEYSNTVAAGNIAGQNPIADTRALIGSKVIIVKSLGKPTVPRLVGKKAETANIAIVRAGLTVGTVTTVYNNAIAANRVISQDIAASTKVDIGSAVNYTMSLGKN